MSTLSEIKRPKGVQIVFEGEETPRTLLFDMNAMCVLEERFGDALAAFNKMIGGQGEDESKPNISFVTLRALLFAGLAHEDETLTEQQVGAKIGFDNMSELADKIIEAFNLSIPGEQQNSGKNQ
ncbi:tail protein [Paenibacillus phage Wanderer]|uniref:Tail assembly protein n=3 Tax=Gochnauervirinae TaxID=2842525 RepID=A0A345ARH6_9CAUD|nr:tail protein [Paenibacillus phage Dragolir]YP_010080234.1 tail protein [Paenibacillus phage Wanderer]AUS03418.1 hypothetical protein DRAGOLIR_12 [Paenibacillus phage Dragolir]AXF39430.1 tail assembly protein [Paenibacillus phage Wanderer]AXF40314.1 tail assembly protein [Paenibacillus phage LincolnB]